MRHSFIINAMEWTSGYVILHYEQIFVLQLFLGFDALLHGNYKNVIGIFISSIFLLTKMYKRLQVHTIYDITTHH